MEKISQVIYAFSAVGDITPCRDMVVQNLSVVKTLESWIGVPSLYDSDRPIWVSSNDIWSQIVASLLADTGLSSNLSKAWQCSLNKRIRLECLWRLFVGQRSCCSCSWSDIDSVRYPLLRWSFCFAHSRWPQHGTELRSALLQGGNIRAPPGPEVRSQRQPT